MKGLSGHMEGPGGGGASRPGRARRDTWKDLWAEKRQGLQDLAEGPMEEPQEDPPLNREQMSRSKDYCKSCRKTHQKSYRKDCGKSCRKVQPEKTDAAVKLQPPGHQGPAEKLQEGPGRLPGHMEGPGDEGAPWPRRDRQ